MTKIHVEVEHFEKEMMLVIHISAIINKEILKDPREGLGIIAHNSSINKTSFNVFLVIKKRQMRFLITIKIDLNIGLRALRPQEIFLLCLEEIIDSLLHTFC